MGLTVSSLSDYTNQESERLIHRLHFENTTGRLFQIQPGIKSAEALQLFEATAVRQTDSCGFTASGDAAFTQRVITVGGVKYQDQMCMKDLNAKWTQILNRPGSRAENEDTTGAVAEAIAMDILALIQEHNELAAWQGDTASGDEVLNKYDGLIKIIDAASGVVTGNTSGITAGTGITSGSSGNITTIVDNMCLARPAKLKRAANQFLFMGTDTFDKLIVTLKDKNLFHTDVTNERGVYEYRIPSWNVTAIGVHGLDGTDRLFLGQDTNFFMGVDLSSDDEEFEIWYSKDDRVVKYSVQFKMGFQVAYPAEIVEFTLA